MFSLVLELLEILLSCLGLWWSCLFFHHPRSYDWKLGAFALLSKISKDLERFEQLNYLQNNFKICEQLILAVSVFTSHR